MKKRTIKIIISVAASVVVLTAGIVAATGNYLPANRVSAPDMKYSVGVKVGEMTAGYVPVGIGIRGRRKWRWKLKCCGCRLYCQLSCECKLKC